MKKNISLFFLSILSVLIFTTQLCAETPSSDSKLAELTSEHNDATVLGANTLAVPLATQFEGTPGFAQNIALFGQPAELGFEGDLIYREIENGYRVQYQNLTNEASFFILLKEPVDLRNRWVRLRYQGPYAPRHLLVEFDHAETRNDTRFDLYLENSAETDSISFKLPDKESFANIDSVRFIFDPEFMEDTSGDFLIYNVELLDPDEDPLAQLPRTDLSRFDFYAEPLQARNQTRLNGGSTF